MGRLERREMVLLRLTSEHGLVGLGEAVPLSLRGGTALETVVGELRSWSEAAAGRDIQSARGESPGSSNDGPAAPGEGQDDSDQSVQGGSGPISPAGGSAPWTGLSAPTRCAIETALSDLTAREAEVPLHQLLSPGSEPEPVFCNATLTTDSPAGVLRQAEAWAEEGFTVFKLKLGSGDDFGQVEAVRSGIGPNAEIRLDANGTWTLEQAAKALNLLEPLGIELAEQPVADLATMARLRQRTSIPLVCDESVSDSQQAEKARRLDACDAITVKLNKIGGLEANLGGHLPTYLSSALDGPVGIAAAAHVVQTIPQEGHWSETAHGLATSRLFSEDIASRGCRLHGSRLHLPEGPGLGVEVDEDSLQAHRL